MIFRIFVIAVLLYLIWRALRGDVSRKFRGPETQDAAAVDTVKCPRCGAYVAVGARCTCSNT